VLPLTIALRPSWRADGDAFRAFLEAAIFLAWPLRPAGINSPPRWTDGSWVLVLERMDQDGSVRSLAVTPESRRQGLAARLDDAALRPPR